MLVVDDDPAFRAAVRRLMEARALQVVGEAGTASEAYAAALRLKPDGVLVDVDLPDDDGIALAHRLAVLAWRPRVLLTSTDPDAVGPGELELDGLVSRTFTLDQINEAMDEVRAGSALRNVIVFAGT